MTKEGVSIREYPSAVRSFAVTSVGIGGESAVRYEDGNLWSDLKGLAHLLHWAALSLH